MEGTTVRLNFVRATKNKLVYMEEGVTSVYDPNSKVGQFYVTKSVFQGEEPRVIELEIRKVR